MFLIQQLYLLQDVLPHFGEAGSSLLPTPQHQTVLVVTGADAIQGLSHGLQEDAHYSLLQVTREHESSRDGRHTFQLAACKSRLRQTDLIPRTRIQTTTHNTAVFFIIHFLHLQAVRLKDTRSSHCYSGD